MFGLWNALGTYQLPLEHPRDDFDSKGHVFLFFISTVILFLKACLTKSEKK